jgi:hypothetical protein
MTRQQRWKEQEEHHWQGWKMGWKESRELENQIRSRLQDREI